MREYTPSGVDSGTEMRKLNEGEAEALVFAPASSTIMDLSEEESVAATFENSPLLIRFNAAEIFALVPAFTENVPVELRVNAEFTVSSGVSSLVYSVYSTHSATVNERGTFTLAPFAV